MKKIYILPILILLFFTRCEKVVDVNVPSSAPKLIIDAAFNVLFNTTPVTANTVVKLTLSADFFNTTIPKVTNATVFVTNLSNNTVITFLDTNADGNYEPETSFIPTEDIEYELTVIYNNDTYKGKATRVKSPVITDIQQGETTLFTGNETEIEVRFTDNANEDNYYLFDFSNTLFLPIEDRFFNGENYRFSYFFDEEDIELPTTVNVKMSGITKEYFTYFRVLIDQSGQDGGGPFETTPSTLLGNMINTSNEDNFPLGYFHISETDIFPVNLVSKN